MQVLSHRACLAFAGTLQHRSVMIVAGYGATANTLAYCVYLLSKNPTTQEQVSQEVDQFQGQPGQEDLQKFSYVRAVINKALWLSPILLMNRTALKDVQVLHQDNPCRTNGISAMHSSGLTFSSTMHRSALENVLVPL